MNTLTISLKNIRKNLSFYALYYQLLTQGFLPVSIAKENRLEYFDALEAYAVKGELAPFADMVAELEEQRLREYLSIVQQQEPEQGDPVLGE